MSIPRESLIILATLGLTREQAEIVVDMMLEAAQGRDPAIDARRALDRARQQRYRRRLIEGAAAETEPIVIDGKLNRAEWARRRAYVFERDSFTCCYCGADCRDDPQCDHIVPVVQGGSSSVENLATSCRACNSSKSGKSPEEWAGP